MLAIPKSMRQIQPVSVKIIEQQLAGLQRRVTNLEGELLRRPRDTWKQIIGASKGQRLDREAARFGAQWREKENRRK